VFFVARFSFFLGFLGWSVEDADFQGLHVIMSSFGVTCNWLDLGHEGCGVE
jgi:Kef-type K+ transport system membrane component KefB